MVDQHDSGRESDGRFREDTQDPKSKPRHLRRLAILFGIGILAIGFVYWLKPSVGSGPAGPAVPREPFQRTWSERPILLLGLGDSITEGYGASHGKNYFDRLYRPPADEFADMAGLSLSAVFPNLTARNMAQSGSNSLEHLKHQVRLLRLQEPEVFGVVVMTSGGNDIIHDYGRSAPVEGAMYGASFMDAEPWIANFEARLDEMISIITGKFPGGCEIFLANIYDPTDGTGSARLAGLPAWPDGLKILAAYNMVLQRASARYPNVHLVDIHSLFMGHGLSCRMFWRRTYRSEDPHFWYGQVFEDPNDRGYDATRRAFLAAMANVLPNYDFGQTLAEPNSSN